MFLNIIISIGCAVVISIHTIQSEAWIGFPLYWLLTWLERRNILINLKKLKQTCTSTTPKAIFIFNWFTDKKVFQHLHLTSKAATLISFNFISEELADSDRTVGAAMPNWRLVYMANQLVCCKKFSFLMADFVCLVIYLFCYNARSLFFI